MTFVYSFPEQLLPHRRVPGEDSGACGGYEHQDTRDPPQAAGGKVRSRSCSVCLAVTPGAAVASPACSGRRQRRLRWPRAPGHAGSAAGCRRESPLEELQRLFGGHSWSSSCLIGVFRTKAAAPAAATSPRTRGIRRRLPAGKSARELQRLFGGHSWSSSCLHRRVPDEGSGAGGGHEPQNTRDPPQAAGGKVRSRSCSVCLAVTPGAAVASPACSGRRQRPGRRSRAPGHAGSAAGYRRESPLEELQRSFGHSFLKQQLPHLRDPDESSGPGGGHEPQDTRDPPQAAGGRADRELKCVRDCWFSACGSQRLRMGGGGFPHM